MGKPELPSHLDQDKYESQVVQTILDGVKTDPNILHDAVIAARAAATDGTDETGLGIANTVFAEFFPDYDERGRAMQAFILVNYARARLAEAILLEVSLDASKENPPSA